VDSSASGIRTIVRELPDSSTVRIATAGMRLSGQLLESIADSVTLSSAKTIQTVSIRTIDTLWVRRRHRYGGLLGGVAFGAVMFGILQLEDSSEDPGLNTRMGLMFLGGAAAVGLLVDAASSDWTRRYPTSQR
jgi:hypothetical protein